MTTLLAAATTARADTASERLRVPWATVLPLAVVAAFGNEFWLIALRGAIGAIERSQGPFLAWLLESTLLLPLYVFAILAAHTLALRWFGPAPLRPRAVAGTLLLTATASTLAALAVQAANAVHDYHLQVTHVANMALHMPTCDAVCVTDREQSALLLQVHALGTNGWVMFVSNLVLLSLVVALRGGRLDLASSRPRPRRSARFENVELFLMTALLGTAAIHATLIREQLTGWPLAGIALLILSIAEMDAALLFLLRLRSLQFVATALVSAAPPVVWLYSHTAGLPFGPGERSASPVGLTGATTALLAAVTLVVAITALGPRRRRTPGVAEHPFKVAVTGVVAVTVAAAAVGLGLLGNEHATKLQQGDHVHNATALTGPR